MDQDIKYCLWPWKISTEMVISVFLHLRLDLYVFPWIVAQTKSLICLLVCFWQVNDQTEGSFFPLLEEWFNSHLPIPFQLLPSQISLLKIGTNQPKKKKKRIERSTFSAGFNMFRFQWRRISGVKLLEEKN